AVRALGQGLRVYMAQFLKPMDAFSGEIAMFKVFGPHFKFHRPNKSCFLENSLTINEKEIEKGFIINEIKYAREEMSKGSYDIFIFDELLTALNLDMIEEHALIELLKMKPEQTEIILTGLKCKKRIMDMADLVTDMRSIKHPYKNGLQARRGIEY
ncbi:MAG: cob(I)yrinic acid a,c-diamide adenosyltransferase, partial [bacterium]